MSEKPSTAPKVTDDLRAVATELLPCPFCGADARAVVNADDEWTVACNNSVGFEDLALDCPAFTIDSSSPDKSEAIAAWNRRALLARPVDEPQYDGELKLEYAAQELAERAIDCRATGANITAVKHDFIKILRRRFPIVPSASSPTKERVELERLRALLNTPEIHDFAKAVVLEALHQRERWAADHDAGKTDADWFWLIGYLAGKALHNPNGDTDKKLHRIITIAAAACNWHAAIAGTDTRMRPGIPSPRWVFDDSDFRGTEELSHSTHKGEV